MNGMIMTPRNRMNSTEHDHAKVLDEERLYNKGKHQRWSTSR